MHITVFSDLDETLLDRRTYSWAPAREALRLLKEGGGFLVLVSSKTLPEMAPIHRALDLDTPFIIENGGGIVAPHGSPVEAELRSLIGSDEVLNRNELSILPLGARYERLTEALREVENEVGIDLRGFADMSVDEVVDLTGLPYADAVNARSRDFDEPFTASAAGPDWDEKIIAAAGRRGLTAVRGGRFWHLMGHQGKGAAVKIVAEAYERLHGPIVTIGLGDGPNDFSFLEKMDIPILVGRDISRPEFAGAPAHARSTRAAGPYGWNEAVIAVLRELTESGTLDK